MSAHLLSEINVILVNYGAVKENFMAIRGTLNFCVNCGFFTRNGSPDNYCTDIIINVNRYTGFQKRKFLTCLTSYNFDIILVLYSYIIIIIS